MLSQGKDDNEVRRKKDKQESANPDAREYKTNPIYCYCNDEKNIVYL